MKNEKPPGYYSITPYLIVPNSRAASEFYQKVFDATQPSEYLDEESGKVCHARVKIGDSIIMFADECVELNLLAPKLSGNSPVGLCLYVSDVDVVLEKAVSAGSKILRPLKNQFHGDRNCQIEDPFGHRWTIATHVEDIPSEELRKRGKAYFNEEMKSLRKMR